MRKNAVGILRVSEGDDRILTTSANFSTLPNLFEKVLTKQVKHGDLPAEYIERDR